MCFATPQAQVTPTNPAPYTPDKAYGAVRSYSTNLKDGKQTGGATIAEQYQAELDNPNARPNIKADPGYRAGANLRM